jgi:hypothetical protein
MQGLFASLAAVVAAWDIVVACLVVDDTVVAFLVRFVAADWDIVCIAVEVGPIVVVASFALKVVDLDTVVAAN